MRFSIETKRFRELFAQAAAGTGKTKPIYKYVLCEVGKNIALVAHTGETSLRLEITGDVSIKQTGSCLMPADELRQLLAELTGETVEFSYDGKLVTECGRVRSRLQVPDHQEFPPMPEIPAGGATVAGLLLEQAIKRTVYATDAKEVRYALGGVAIDATEGVTFVSTDTRRVAIVGIDAKGEFPNLQSSCVIPESACKILQSIAASSESVVISRTDSALFATAEGLTFYARLLQGQFPAYRDVIPDSFATVCRIPVTSLAQTIRQVRVTANNPMSGSIFEFGKQSLRVSSSEAGSGDSVSEIPIALEGPEVRIEARSSFWLDYLRNAPQGETVEISMNGPTELFQLVTSGSVGAIIPFGERA